MPLSAFEISSATHSTSAPITTRGPPAKPAEGQSTKPATIRISGGEDADQEDGAADRDVAGDLLSPALA